MSSRYRAYRETILKDSYQGNDLLPICETFDRAAFDALLKKPDCAHIRIYYGMDESLKIHAIIVAGTAGGADILPASALVEGESEDIVEAGNRCPDLCPEPSPLNT